MTTSRFRYQRSDFSPLPVALEHLDIRLNFLDQRVEGTIDLRMSARQPLETIELDARDIVIHAVTLLAENTPTPLTFEHQPERHKLQIRLPRPVATGTRLTIRVAATCVPTDNVLEGIYLDTTPPGCPQQYMSQCQQWGFQRILPIFDDCTAKCTMTTTIEADARYTHLIANGNIDPALCPNGRPVPKPGAPERQQIRFINPVPMAPYLFLVCVGTWEVLADEVVYPSGRRVQLEYLVPPGRTENARVPMEILKESILWQGRTQEYEYPFDVYRTICMEKSNFGGMENVGNTTIITSAALVDDFTGDRRLEYAHGIIVHEFEHNQCGSDVTMETPFDMWLNEAFTVDVERQFQRSQFNPDVLRLGEVDDTRAPLAGPLAVEDGGHMGNIVREGFNDPDELVDGVTYVKAAEVIRMLRAIIGEDAFRRGKNLYFARYKGGNANTDQFFACFEEISGRELTQFKREWLYTIGYPRLSCAWRHDAATRRLTLELTQSRSGKGGLFHVPLAIAAVDAQGRDIPETTRVLELTGERTAITLENVPPPAFVSVNRDFSFYGTFDDKSATPEMLALQTRLDGNAFNRVEAMRRLTDAERIRLLHDPHAAVGKPWLELVGDILRDNALAPGLQAYLLRIDEQSVDRQYIPWYRERYAARERLLRAVAEAYLPELIKAFHAVDTSQRPTSPRDGVEERRLKAALLRLIAAANTRETHQLAEDHFHHAWNISDRLAALHAIDVVSHPGRLAILEDAFKAWHHHLNGYTSYLMLVGGSPHADAFERITIEEQRPEFKIAHPSHNRALYMPMSANNKLLWSERGLAWLTDTVIRLAPINENTANRLVGALNQVQHLAADLKPLALAALDRMAAGVDAKSAPSAAGRIRAYREGAGA
ncbi:MAG: M1 family metallopeptidase [Verrucomicrobia bacterium]|nr:M1 family metallopeptidase [Verrucomicrobiota bacterium]